jgi:type I restriction enzyme S subunit
VSENGLPNGWQSVPLRQLSEKIVDGSHTPPSGQAQGRPMLSARNIQDDRIEFSEFRLIDDEAFDLEHRRTSVTPGDVLLTIVGTIGRSAVVPETSPAFTLQRSVAVLHPTALLSRLCMYQFQSPAVQKWFLEKARGTAQKGVYLGSLGELELLVPPATEQVRLLSQLDALITDLDAAAAGLKRVQANLKRYRASVLKAACEGRLVPTEAELARKENRSYESGEQLLQRILKERRAKWEADQLAKMDASGKPPKDGGWKRKYKEPTPPDTTEQPKLPEGWMWTSLGQAFEVCVGATPSRAKPEFWSGAIPWVSSGEVAFCRITNTRESITEIGLRNTSTQLHPEGTVLIGMIGEGKTRGQVAILDIPACNNQNSAAIRVSSAGLPPEFVYRYLEGRYEQTRVLGSGNNQPALNKTRVENMLFPLPPLAEQHRISLKVESCLSIVQASEVEVSRTLRRASRLRQSILKRAFEGKLVPQDPNDEPASVLLDRIRAGREETQKGTSGKSKRALAGRAGLQ